MHLSAQPTASPTARRNDTTRPVLNAPPRGGCKYNIEINTKCNKSRLCNEVVKVLDLDNFSFLVQLDTYDLK